MALSTLFLSTMVLTAALCAADRPEVGTWKLNLERSTLRHSPDARTMTIEPSSGNTYRVTFDGSNTVYALTFDVESIPANSAGTSRYARRIDEHHTQQVLRIGGKDVGTIDTVISLDGKTMTCVYRSTDDNTTFAETYVYDKQ